MENHTGVTGVLAWNLTLVINGVAVWVQKRCIDTSRWIRVSLVFRRSLAQPTNNQHSTMWGPRGQKRSEPCEQTQSLSDWLRLRVLGSWRWRMYQNTWWKTDITQENTARNILRLERAKGLSGRWIKKMRRQEDGGLKREILLFVHAILTYV